MRYAFLAVLSVIGLTYCALAQDSSPAQGPSAEVMKAVSRSVVQVIARDCDGATRTASGFLWGNSQQVVTALHAVSGCGRIASYFQGVGEVGARPVRQLVNADLVLMQLDRSATGLPLKESAASPAVNDKLQAIGFYYGVPTLDNRAVTVTIGASTLEDMLTDTLKEAIMRAGSPDLSVRIIRLDGHLLPGLSGAPIVNYRGEVVGIGSGGLENGAAGVSWAVVAAYLKQFKTASPFTPTRTLPYAKRIFFSTEEGFSGKRSITCGDLDFVYLRRGTVEQFSRSTDSPAGLIQLASAAGLSSNEVSTIPLDGYVNPESGGTFVLPAGSSLTQEGTMCRVSLSQGDFMWIASARTNSPMRTQQITVGWEQTWSQKVPVTWVAEPSYSYLAPYTRTSDGLIVNRKTSNGYEGMTPKALAFETLMLRGDSVMGIIAMNQTFDPLRHRECLSNPTFPSCSQFKADYLNWSAAVLGTFLSTFPPR